MKIQGVHKYNLSVVSRSLQEEDQLFQKMDRELAELRRRMYTLANTKRTINKLPAHILRKIFYTIFITSPSEPGEPNALLAINQVCRRWRELARELARGDSPAVKQL